MFVTFMLLVSIVYLNLLVAILTNRYTEARKEEVQNTMYPYCLCSASAEEGRKAFSQTKFAL